MDYTQKQLIEKAIISKFNKLENLVEKKSFKAALYKGDQEILMSGYGLVGLLPYTIIIENEKYSNYITITIESNFEYKHVYVDEWYYNVIHEEEEEIPTGYITFNINQVKVYIPIIKNVGYLTLPEGYEYEDYNTNPVDKEKRIIEY